MEKIANNKLKHIPDVYVGGGASVASSGHGGLMSPALLNYLTGRGPVSAVASTAVDVKAKGQK